MFEFLKKLFCCSHNFVDKCSVKTYNGLNWQDVCSSRAKNKHCRKHDEKYNILDGYCDYYYQQCSKCGKIKKNPTT